MYNGISFKSWSWQWVLYLTATSLGICLFVFINATQSLVLTHILNIPTGELGDKAGTISFADQLVSLAAVYVFGVSSDFLGRRIVYSFGFVAMGAALAGTPWVHTYGQLLCARLVFALGGGAASAMVAAVFADFAGGGRAAGLVGLSAGLGALLALFALVPLPLRFGDVGGGIRAAFVGVGVLAAAFGVLLLLFLKKPSDSEADQQARPVKERKSVYQTAKEGITAAANPKILLGYAGSFLARGDTVILTLFVPLWVYKNYIDQRLCVVPGGPNDPDIKEVCRAAYSKAYAISGVAQTAALVGAPLLGYLSDKFKATNIVFSNAILGLLAYTTLFYANPLSGLVFAVAVFVGLSEIGLIIGNLSLVTDNEMVDQEIRGSVAGVSSACGAIGILVSTKLGGVLFDVWDDGAPFFVLAVGHLVLVVVAAVVWWGDRRGRNSGSSNNLRADSDVVPV
ncbi:major facilitator superfamily domain-containing protein [Obelidium mucronatum]|nr:major facilitator superfamily domain-containing protein [Obelidium mucronatum]